MDATQTAAAANEIRQNIGPDLYLVSELADFAADAAEEAAEDVAPVHCRGCEPISADGLTLVERQALNARMAAWWGVV
jgi:hypothetical protein